MIKEEQLKVIPITTVTEYESSMDLNYSSAKVITYTVSESDVQNAIKYSTIFDELRKEDNDLLFQLVLDFQGTVLVLEDEEEQWTEGEYLVLSPYSLSLRIHLKYSGEIITILILDLP